MDIGQNAFEKSILDALYCNEENLESVEVVEETVENLSLFRLPLLEQDLLWNDEDLQSLFTKEKENCFSPNKFSSFSHERKQAVEWMLKINAHYGFSALTAILSVNFLDRFCSSLSFQNEKKPWMMQLTAVTCLSLAAKVEETHVPLLLDLQVEGTEYVFEAKTIQRMELLVLSSLKWKMNPITPLSFLDHIMTRLGLKSYIHWEFLKSCENLILSLVTNSRSMHYLPSVLATATMLHVIYQFEPRNGIDYENQLLSVLKIDKEEVDECYEFILDTLDARVNLNALKRKSSEMDSLLSEESSNESWGAESCISSYSSSPNQTFLKKRRVFVETIKSPH